MKKQLLIVLVASFAITAQARAEGKGDVAARLAALSTDSDTLSQQLTESAQLTNEYAQAWIQKTHEWMNDPKNEQRDLIRSASEIPFVPIVARDTEALVLINSRGTTELGILAHGSAVAKKVDSSSVRPYLLPELMTEGIVKASRDHLLKAAREANKSLGSDAKALAEAIRMQQEGVLEAGRFAAFERVLGPLFAEQGPAALAAARLAQLNNLPTEGGSPPSFKLPKPKGTSSDVELKLVLYQKPHVNSVAVVFQNWHVMPGDPAQLAERLFPTGWRPIDVLKSVEAFVADAKARSDTHLGQLRRDVTKLVPKPSSERKQPAHFRSLPARSHR